MRPIPFNSYWKSTSIVKNNVARKLRPRWIFQLKVRKIEITAKSGYPALIWPFNTSLFSALSWNKLSHMKLQSLKMFKTTKDIFYKQFDFFCELTGPIMGLREPCPLCHNFPSYDVIRTSKPSVAMTTQWYIIPFLQWYEMHTVLLRFSSCIPVLILKSQILRFSQTNNCSEINKFLVQVEI